MAQRSLAFWAGISGEVAPARRWRSVLVLRHGAAGDVLRTGAVVGAIRRSHPDAQIELGCGVAARGFAELLEGVDGIRDMPDPYQSFGASARALFSGKARRPDVVISLHPGARHGWLACLGARLHWIGFSDGECLESRHVQPWPTPDEGGWNRLADGFAPASDKGSHTWNSIRPPSQVSMVHARTLVRSLAMAGAPVLLAAGGGGPDIRRRWPEECYRSLGRKLVRGGIPVAWVGTTTDPGGGVDGVMDWRGETNPAVLAALLRCASALVGNDSAPAVLSGLIGIPTVMVAGPTGVAPGNVSGPSVRVVRHGTCPPCWVEEAPIDPCGYGGACLTDLRVSDVHRSVLAVRRERAA